MSIPKISHRIWFGEPFPDKYRCNLRTLAESNPSYVTKLWSDPSTMSEEAYEKLKIFCSESKVTLCNIREHTELDNFNIITRELDAAQKDLQYKRLHYVRASDVARIAILYKEGGNYSDTDSKVMASFPELEAKHDVLFKLMHPPTLKHNYNFFEIALGHFKHKYFFCNILYDFIACAPQHALLKTANEITQGDYKTYSESKHRGWESSSNGADLCYGTVRLTGSALKTAINYHYQTGKLCFEDPSELFFDADTIMESTYDKSWLEGFKCDYDVSHSHSELVQFLDEIDSCRFQRYQVYDHGGHPDLRNVSTNESSDLLRNVMRKAATKKNLLGPKLSGIKLADLNLIKIKLPEIKLDPTKISIDFNSLLSTKNIKALYQKNGGGFFSTKSIFNSNEKRTVEEVIKLLQVRAADNPDPYGASRKTLVALKKDVTPMKKN